jgi:hypothetical protein
MELFCASRTSVITDEAERASVGKWAPERSGNGVSTFHRVRGVERPARNQGGTVSEVMSRSSIRSGFGTVVLGAALVTALALPACHDTVAPRRMRPSIGIVPVADSVFEGDTVRLTALVLDEMGAPDTTAPVTWSVNDTTLAEVVGEGLFALRRPGTARIAASSGTVATTYPLVIGGLVARRVELTPATINMGRTDQLPVTARVLGQGDRAITGRTVTFTSDDSLIATVAGPVSAASPNTGLLIAVRPGSTTIGASVDDVTGTAVVEVVDADTTFVLTDYEGSPLPVLVETDSVSVDGETRYFELYADSGTLVLSGLLQERYQIDVEYSGYHVTQPGDTVGRELILQVRGQFDRGVVTVGANGSLSLLSEIIGPRLEHTATHQGDGYRVHYRIPGEHVFLDLRYQRAAP